MYKVMIQKPNICSFVSQGQFFVNFMPTLNKEVQTFIVICICKMFKQLAYIYYNKCFILRRILCWLWNKKLLHHCFFYSKSFM